MATGMSSTGCRQGAGTRASRTRTSSLGSQRPSRVHSARPSSWSSFPAPWAATAGCTLVAAAALLVGLRSWRAAQAAPEPSGSVPSPRWSHSRPVLTPDARRYLDEAYLELWRAVGRDDLAVSVGRDITRSASNVTWYGPLGALLVVAGIVIATIAARRHVISRGSARSWRRHADLLARGDVGRCSSTRTRPGRFLMTPVALAGATWGLVGRARPLAWGLTGIAITALALAVLNDTKRPSGLPLLERPAPASYWTTPRWRGRRERGPRPRADPVRRRARAVRRVARPRDHRERPRLRASRAATSPVRVARPRRLGRSGCELGVRQPGRARAARHGSAARGSVSRSRPTAGPHTGACAPAADAHRGSRAGGGDRTRITSLEG